MANTQEPHAKIYKTQGATAIVVSSGGEIQVTSGGEINFSAGASCNFGANAVLNLTSGQVTFPGSLAKGYIDLSNYIFNAKQLASAETLTTASGVIINAGGTPPIALTASGDQSLYVNWASADVNAIKLAPVALPSDLDTAGGITISLYGETIGSATAADAVQALDIRCWMNIGDTEMGSTHPDFTSTPAFKSITLASGDITTGILNITLVPQAHAGRAIRLYGGKIEYQKKTS